MTAVTKIEGKNNKTQIVSITVQYEFATPAMNMRDYSVNNKLDAGM